MIALDLDALERESRAMLKDSYGSLSDDLIRACLDRLALIARLRAAEARTAWQPIETAPGAWLVGRRANKPPVVVVDMDRGLLGHPPRFVDEHGIVQHITAWAAPPRCTGGARD